MFVADAAIEVFGVVVVVKPSHGDFFVLVALVQRRQCPCDFFCARGVEVQQLYVKAKAVERLFHVLFEPLYDGSVECERVFRH